MKYTISPFLCGVFVAFYVYAIYLWWYMYNYDASKVLSNATTFAVQVATGGAVWCAFALLLRTTIGIVMSTLQDLIVLYFAMIGTGFFALVVPLNGIPTDTAEFVIQGMLPVLFFHNWWKRRRQDVWRTRALESRTVVYAYPVLYWCFALVVSWQRERMLYPLMNPLFVGGVVLALELGRLGLLKVGAIAE